MKRDLNGIKMTAIIDARLSGKNWKEFKDSDQGVTFGGYCFNVNVKGKQCDVNFDWDSFAGNVMDNGFLRLEAGVSNFFQDAFQDADSLSDVYDLEYQDAGFTRYDLTAEVLSNAEEIVEFTMDYDDALRGDYIRLVSVHFEDRSGKKYHIPQHVLFDFNYLGVEEYLKHGFNLGSCDLDGFEITEEDVRCVLNRTDTAKHLSLPEITFLYFSEVREIMNQDLEAEEEK